MIVSEKTVVEGQGFVVVGVHGDRVVIGIQGADVRRDRLTIGIGRVVLFAQIPDDGQVVAESRYDFGWESI